ANPWLRDTIPLPLPPFLFPLPSWLIRQPTMLTGARRFTMRSHRRRVDLEGVMLAKLAAEFLGTFWLVLGGCGSAVLAAAFPELGIGFAGVSLAFGLTVLTADRKSTRLNSSHVK